MSRWIDADALTKYVEDSNKSAGLHIEDLRKIRKWIKKAPSIDIVRCKECKYDHKCNHSVQRITSKPGYMSIIYVPIGWCERGEKSE